MSLAVIFTLADKRQLYVTTSGYAAVAEQDTKTNINPHRRTLSHQLDGSITFSDRRELYVCKASEGCSVAVAKRGQSSNKDPAKGTWIWKDGALSLADGRKVYAGTDGYVYVTASPDDPEPAPEVSKWEMIEAGLLSAPEPLVLYANQKGACGANCKGEDSNKDDMRRTWLVSKEGVISLLDGRQFYCTDKGYGSVAKEGEDSNTEDARRKWIMASDGILTLADGRQLYMNTSGWACVGKENTGDNVDVDRRSFNFVKEGTFTSFTTITLKSVPDAPRIFLSHTGETAMLSFALKGLILSKIPNAKVWMMEDIPVGAGSHGSQKFNQIIQEEMAACSTVLGICDKTVAKSHPEWGSPAEWRMGLRGGKTVLVLCIDGHMDEALQNPTCLEVAKHLQFFPIPDGMNAMVTKMIKTLVEHEIVPRIN